MPQINYDAYTKKAAERDAQSNSTNRASYFALKNDRDEAIVRIMHDSTDDFDIVAVHPTFIQGKRRNVNCLRSPEEPLDKCPFCAANKPIRTKMYIHMLQYIKNQDGSVSAIPVLWDRSASYAADIASKLKTYGPLSDNLFKITRHGAAGSMTTTYSIDYAPPTIFNPDVYKKDVNLMQGIKALGSAVLDKNAEQMQELLANESATSEPEQAPMPDNPPPVQSSYQTATTFQNQAESFQPTPTIEQQTAPQTPIYNQAQSTQPMTMSRTYTPESVETEEIPRPRRYY